MTTMGRYTSGHRFRRCFTKPEARFVCALLFAMIGAGCGGGDTNRKVIQRYQPQFNEKRQQFKKIAEVLPGPESVKDPVPASLSPKPVYDEKNHGSSNTEIVMYDQLLDPDVKSEGHQRLDLLLSGDLLDGMRWTGPNSPMSADALDRRNPDFEATLKQGLATRYLVVLRPVSYVAPVATNETAFNASPADIVAYIVDLPEQKVAGSFRYKAAPSSSVEYSTKKGDNTATRQSQLEQFAYSSLYEDARKKLKPLLEQATGGSFTLER